jgi:YHS domain-containing protein
MSQRKQTMTNLNRLSAILACTLMIGVVGCKPKPIAAPSGEPKASDGPLLAPPQQPAASATPQADGGDNAEPAKIKASLALLSTDDRALAEKQKICPVSGEALGAMGAPKKISVAGHEVFICCQGCEKELAGEPDKYLAKLGLQPAK